MGLGRHGLGGVGIGETLICLTVCGAITLVMLLVPGQAMLCVGLRDDTEGLRIAGIVLLVVAAVTLLLILTVLHCLLEKRLREISLLCFGTHAATLGLVLLAGGISVGCFVEFS